MRYILTLGLLLLLYLSGLIFVASLMFIVKLYSPGIAIIEVPFSFKRVYIVKVSPSERGGPDSLDITDSFKRYIDYFESIGWVYLPEKRLGRLLFFQKTGVIKSFIFPKFIGLLWFH